jgi:hypothetical protein
MWPSKNNEQAKQEEIFMLIKFKANAGLLIPAFKKNGVDKDRKYTE